MTTASTCRGTHHDAYESVSSAPARAATLIFACIPKFGCPLCWPFLAGACSFLGLPFSLLNPIITACTALALVATVGTVLVKRSATLRSGLAIASLLSIFVCKVWVLPPWVGYAGSAGLLAVAVWGTRERRDLASQSVSGKRSPQAQSEAALSANFGCQQERKNKGTICVWYR